MIQIVPDGREGRSGLPASTDARTGAAFRAHGDSDYPEKMSSHTSHTGSGGTVHDLPGAPESRISRTGAATAFTSLVIGAILLTGCTDHNRSEVTLAGSAGVEDGTGDGNSPTDRSTPPDLSAPCPAAQLTAAVDSTNAGAGHTFYTVRLTNNGSPCTLSGYPGVSLIDAAGNQVGAAADREIGAKGHPTRLDTGSSATFSTRFSQPHAYNPEACEPTERAQHMKIYPPNDTGWLTIPVSQSTCGSDRISTITVTGVGAD
ncbi:DUF4232 domain-containing protein [Corynebacterium pygosceleis]|uniref:DUF4232 domain-containing protein n=1 Tax=Corynebacterium pygosceleis TaxID=2800406 RepID=UPI0019053F57|nr:DUF4232 domain-containing protein [Corynebacterium pygosceleis]MCL0120883.1 DUF4232 domain-containing protein [Corynebacterium pygosceleis]